MEDFITLSEIEMMCLQGGREEDIYDPVAPYGVYYVKAPYGVVQPDKYYAVMPPYGIVLPPYGIVRPPVVNDPVAY